MTDTNPELPDRTSLETGHDGPLPRPLMRAIDAGSVVTVHTFDVAARRRRMERRLGDLRWTLARRRRSLPARLTSGDATLHQLAALLAEQHGTLRGPG